MNEPLVDNSHENQNKLRVLRLRAWMGHIVVSLQKVSMLMVGQNGWNTALKNRQEIEHDEVLYDWLEPYIRNSMISIIVIGVLLDLLCIKWKAFADCYIYLELINFALYSLIPVAATTDPTGLYAYW